LLSDTVIELYKKGLEELEIGIAIKIPNQSDSRYKQAHDLREKMITNLKMTKDRLDHLSMQTFFLFLLSFNLFTSFLLI